MTMFEIPIFKEESNAGLSDKIRTSGLLSYASTLAIASPFTVDQKSLKLLVKGGAADFDLHYLKTILVTTGWNKNDDVFDRYEVFAARKTPEDKPFNYEHNCDDIIGHMIDQAIVDDDGKVHADDAVIDDLPAKFHIVVGAVLYKHWDKEELQERMDTILEEIAKGNWFVSMEALFRNFDYAIVDKAGASKVIARNEQTAFLTKHLRAYGGSGLYEEQKVGRLLRNITFSGKGLVRKPANPESIILSKSNFLMSSEKSGYSNTEPLAPKESEKDMAIETELQKLQAENEKLKAELQNTNVKQVEAKLQAASEELALVIKAKHEAEASVKTANEQVAQYKTEIETLKASADKATKEYRTVSDELATLKAKQKHSERVSAVCVQLKLEQPEAEAIAKSLSELSDDAFTAHLTAISKFAPKGTPAPLPPKGTPAQLPPAAVAAETDPAEGNADAGALENVKPTVEPALGGNGAVGAESVRKSIAAYFDCDETEGETDNA